jgi:hypothetical protein
MREKFRYLSKTCKKNKKSFPLASNLQERFKNPAAAFYNKVFY